MTSKTLLAITWVLFAPLQLFATTPGRADELWFGKVQPLLDRSCFKCHGGVRQKSGLDLRSLERILNGGDRGPAIVPGNPEASHLLQFVRPGADPHMPQDEKKQLIPQEMDAIREWIAALPGTNIVSAAKLGQGGWTSAYLKAFGALNKPAWTPPPTMDTHQAIDHFIELGWAETTVEPSAICDDRTFARRAYLDLCGRIPKVSELEAFLFDGRANKRALLVDSLLISDEYARHMREVFDVVLMERRDEKAENQRRDHGWFKFLEHAFGENYPWDKIVRELILARPSTPEDRGAVWYLYERKDNYQAMAEALAPVAFGEQIGCAQCHNHPLVAEVEQRHYWGLVAAFNRSKNVECAAGPGIAESAVGGFISFANLKKESQPALLAFLNGTVVSERRPAEGEKESDAPDLYLVPPPKEKEKSEHAAVPRFSRRQALADAVTQNNPQLARAFVNRVWALLLGRGLVNPVDQLDAMHRPSHPDLFNWLAADFEKHGYDIKRLVREIVLTHVYQLDSQPCSGTAAPPEALARGLEKPLSAEQLFHSFLVATGNVPSPEGKVCGRDENELRRAFVRQFPDLLTTDYNATLQEATFLSNSPLLDELLAPTNGNTAALLLQHQSAVERVQLAFHIVLEREPEPDELSRCRAFLEARAAEPGVRELLWALLTSAEFQINH
jgi:hypothetical protein